MFKVNGFGCVSGLGGIMQAFPPRFYGSLEIWEHGFC